MAKVELLPELWCRVIELLRQPLPRPTGNNPRSSIRQHTLTICMRVNKLFNNITAPILYSIIVTDHLPSLIYGHDLPPAASDIPSKVGLLGNLTRLYLEYSSKDHSTYEQICREGKRHYEGIGVDEAGLMKLCEQECDWIDSASHTLSDFECKKRSISTGVFLHGQAALWSAFADYKYPDGRPLPFRAVAARKAVSRLSVMPYPTSYCHHVQLGPLLFASLPYDDERVREPAPGGPRRVAHCAHLSMGAGIPPIIAGHPSRWYLHYGELRSEAEIEAAIDDLATAMGALLGAREIELRQVHDQVDPVTLPARSWVHVDIYCPPIFFAPERKERFLELFRSSQKFFLGELGVPLERSVRDEWVLHDTGKTPAPRCEACDWCTDDL